MAFQYKPRSAQKWEERANQRGNDFLGFIGQDFKTFTPEKGNNYIRILPPTWDDAEHYGLDIYVHYGIGPERAALLCPQKMKIGPCPICEAGARAARAGDEELKKELDASKRVMVWMINRNDEKQGPMIWTMPWSLDRDIVKVCRDPHSGEIYMIDDPNRGFDVGFERTGDGVTTKYVGIQIARKESSIPQDFLDYVVECPLPSALEWRDYDTMKSIYEGAMAASGRTEGTTSESTRNDPPPRNDPPRHEGPAAAPAGTGGFRPRGGAGGAAAEPPRNDPPPRDDPPPQSEADYGRSDPPPRNDPPPASGGGTSAATRAAELRARFGRK